MTKNMIFVLFIIGCYSCIKDKNCQTGSNSTYHFDLSYTISPVKDTFSVGDTLWVDHSFGNTFFNKWDSKEYTLNDFDFETFFALQDMKTNPMIPTSDFTLIHEDGSIANESKNAGAYLKYTYQNGMYKWKRGIVLTRPGWFMFGFGTDIETNPLSSTGQSVTGCRSEWMNLWFTLNNSPSNAYLTSEATDENQRNVSEELMRERGYVAFYVKE